MLALFRNGPGTLEIKEVAIPTVGRDEVLVKIKSCGVCGSDLARFNSPDPKWDGIILGHEASGVIEKTGEPVVIIPLIPCLRCEFCRSGRYSLCPSYSFIGSRRNGCFAEYVSVPKRNVLKVPKGLSFNHLCFVEPLSVVIHALKKLRSLKNKNVLVFGAGAIGLLAISVAKYYGALKVAGVDIVEEKLFLAKKAGAVIVFNALDSHFTEKINKEMPSGPEVIIDCSGSQSAFALILQVIKKAGEVVLIGTPTKQICVDWQTFELINRKELTILGSWMSYSKPFPGAEWQEAVKLIPQITAFLDLISVSISLKKSSDILKILKKPSKKPIIKLIINP